MPQTTWTTTLLLIITVHTVKSDHLVTVRPADSDASICGDHSTCDTLSNLITNKSAIFSEDNSNLVLNFLNGTHTVLNISSQIRMERIRNVTLFGLDALILCKGTIPFIFVDIWNLELRGLTFSECGGKVLINSNSGEQSIVHDISAALFFSNVNSLHMEGVTVTLSNGYGLFIYNFHGNAYIFNCTFLKNRLVTIII